jgi:hypothetical protein
MHGASNAALGLKLGNRIQVYWPDDDAWCDTGLGGSGGSGARGAFAVAGAHATMPRS